MLSNKAKNKKKKLSKEEEKKGIGAAKRPTSKDKVVLGDSLVWEYEDVWMWGKVVREKEQTRWVNLSWNMGIKELPGPG